MDKERPKAFSDLLKLSSLGLEMGGAVVIGLLMGTWLDRQFGTEPWLTFVFLGFGLVAAGKAVYRAVRKGLSEEAFEEARQEAEQEAEQEAGQGTGQMAGPNAGPKAGKEARQDDGREQ
jgi:ATP synthase protein I